METRTADGWILRGERRGRSDAPAVVVLGHAMMVDRRSLDRPRGGGLASALVARGFEVLLFDARGHGESGPSAADGARWDYDEIVRYDVPAMVEAAREVAAGRPVALLGHSLIGHAAMIAAGLRPDAAPDAIVAYAPNLWAPRLEPSPVARAAKRATLEVWHAWSAARGLFDPSTFGMGRTAEALPYISQFRAMWRRDRLGSESGASDYEAAMGAARVPMLAVASENDRLLARPASVRAFAALARNSDVEVVVLSGADAPSHAAFVTDTRSRPLWDESASWIERRLLG